MIHSVKYLFLIFIIFGLFSASFAQHTVSQKEESRKDFSRLKSLTVGADVVVTGKVSQKKSDWNEKKTRIFTKTTVLVDEYLKGQNAGRFVEIITPGGEVGEVGELYTHMPRFADNEEVVVFLKQNGTARDYRIFNGEEGKITVLQDEKTREKVTRSNIRINNLKSKIRKFVDGN
jgi:hypothetical protein